MRPGSRTGKACGPLCPWERTPFSPVPHREKKSGLMAQGSRPAHPARGRGQSSRGGWGSGWEAVAGALLGRAWQDPCRQPAPSHPQDSDLTWPGGAVQAGDGGLLFPGPGWDGLLQAAGNRWADQGSLGPPRRGSGGLGVRAAECPRHSPTQARRGHLRPSHAPGAPVRTVRTASPRPGAKEAVGSRAGWVAGAPPSPGLSREHRPEASVRTLPNPA